MEFTAPWAGPCSDWVLVLDDARYEYPPPGSCLTTRGTSAVAPASETENHAYYGEAQ
jgi:hypothetical protein